MCVDGPIVAMFRQAAADKTTAEPPPPIRAHPRSSMVSFCLFPITRCPDLLRFLLSSVFQRFCLFPITRFFLISVIRVNQW
jgi:hypothetical protein